MATNETVDSVVIEIITEYKESVSRTRSFMALIRDEAKKAQVSWATIADGLVKRFPEVKKEILAAQKLLEGAKRNTSEWAKEAEKAAKAFERAKFAQAKSKVSGLFVDDDFMSSIGKAAADERARYLNAAAQATDSLTNSTNKSSQAMGTATQATKRFDAGLFSLRNVARTALGTFEAMAIFFLTQFVGNAISKVIDSLKQLELSFYRLSIAERALSKAGVDITPQQLVDIADQVTKTYATVSGIDATKMVSNLAVLTKDLKLTADQYEKIAMAIPLIAQQADVSIESATDQIITGLTKSGRGWADLGITVDAAIIRQEAVTSGIVESAEAYDALTAEQKQQVEVLALINILYENANENLASQEGYLTTVAGKQALLNKEWETFTTEVGLLGSPAIKSGLDFMIWAIQQLIVLINYAKLGYMGFMGVAVGGFFALRGLLDGNVKSLSEFVQLWNQAAAESIRALNDFMTPDIGEDTPTSETEPQSSLAQDQEDLQKALEKMNDEILEAQLKLAQDMEDAQIDLGRKLVDITTEYARKRADAEREYSNRVADINASYRNRLADIEASQQEANQKARNDELEREAKFQEQMRQLKEQFLMDLEDALHARDARQVLRLIKQYNLEKEQAEREHALEKENAEREQEERNAKFARERADAERERRAKLAEAQREYLDKLAKLRADEEAERAAAELAYQRKMEDLEREMQNRLEIVAANLVAEFNLTKEGLDAILALYQKYYSEISGIYAAMNAMLAGQQNLLSGSNKSSGNLLSNKSGKGGSSVRNGFAEGGSMIANRPTTVTFGEAGLEFATFTPIGRDGRDVNKLFSNLSNSAGDGMGGVLELLLSLSPDLEARVVRNTLGQMSNIVTEVRRSKR